MAIPSHMQAMVLDRPGLPLDPAELKVPVLAQRAHRVAVELSGLDDALPIERGESAVVMRVLAHGSLVCATGSLLERGPPSPSSTTKPLAVASSGAAEDRLARSCGLSIDGVMPLNYNRSMATLVTDCPRCGVNKMTFDVGGVPVYLGKSNGWALRYEIFCVCRECGAPSIFRICQDEPAAPNGGNVFSGDWVVTRYYKVEGFVSIKDLHTQQPPEHVPEEVSRAFKEAATCMAVQCWNAAGAMFRTSIDLATQGMLPAEDAIDAPGRGVRRVLALRLAWLFDTGRLPRSLEDLAACIREDANDGVHALLLGKEEADDLLDFTVALLERIYTEPEKLKLAEQRRQIRRAPKEEAQQT